MRLKIVKEKREKKKINWQRIRGEQICKQLSKGRQRKSERGRESDRNRDRY
jgi:hypothetical protein